MFRSASSVFASGVGSLSKSLSSCFRPGFSSEDDSHHGAALDRPIFSDPVERIASHLRALTPYQVGRSTQEISREFNIPEAQIIKLASNENPWVEGHARYPDEFALREAIAHQHGVSPKRVVLGNGSDEILTLTAQIFLKKGAASVMSQYAYLAYKNASQNVGAKIIEVPALDHGNDLVALAEAVRQHDARVVWVANPNNPTGTFIQSPALCDFLNAVPRDVVVVLDEAYWDYLPDHQRFSHVPWLDQHPNLVIAKTFSKIHGLAGHRIGYALMPEKMASVYQSVRQTYPCNTAALEAAHSSLADTAAIERYREHNLKGLVQLGEGLRALGFETLPAHGNFIAFKTSRAKDIFDRLIERGIIIRPLDQYQLHDFLRVSVGRPEENQAFLAALADIVASFKQETAARQAA